MPRAEELPPSLAPIVRRQAVMLSAENFERDANQLISHLERMVADLNKTGVSEQPSTTLPSLTKEQASQRVARLSTTESRLLRRLTLSNRTWVEPELAAVLLSTDKTTAQETLDGLLRQNLLTSSADGKVSFFNEDVREIAAANLAEAEDDKVLQSLRDDIHRWERLNGVYEPQARLSRDYWTVEDLLDYRPYATAIAGFIRYPETRPPLTIGIKAPWGAGKTSLMRMIQQQLDPPLASPERSRQIRLRERTRLVTRRRSLIPRLRRKIPDETSRVTNGELLSYTVQPPTRHDSTGPTLAAQTPSAADGKLPSQDEPFRAELAEDDGILRAGEWRPTVWFNPWMYQNGEQVWAGLAYEIIRQITTRLPIGDRERFWLALNLARLDREAVRRRAYRILLERILPLVVTLTIVLFFSVAVIALGFIFHRAASLLHSVAAGGFSLGVLGVTVGVVTRMIGFFRESASGAFPSVVKEPQLVTTTNRVASEQAKGAYDELIRDPGYDAKLGFLHLVQTDMTHVLNLVATPEQPLIIFVDDLDRCSPSTVAQVIEAINLFLAGEFPNCIFILAMEPAVVAAHVEANYKELVATLEKSHAPGDWSTLGWKFLEKIVQLPLSLPAPGAKKGFASYVRHIVGLSDEPVSGPDESPRIIAESNTNREGLGTDIARESPVRVGIVRADSFDPNISAFIEKAILLRNPTINTLPDIAREVQAAHLSSSETVFSPETRRAMDRIFAILFSDEDAFEAIEAALPALKSQNPREIKRYVNLFRFYAFISHQQRESGQPPQSPDGLAKLAALAIRWPQLVTVLASSGNGDGHPLNLLERAARNDGAENEATDTVVRGQNRWTDALLETGFVDADGNVQPWCHDLRRFLSTGPEIGEVASRLL